MRGQDEQDMRGKRNSSGSGRTSRHTILIFQVTELPSIKLETTLAIQGSLSHHLNSFGNISDGFFP